MAESSRTAIRVLVVDDEADVREAYRQILLQDDVNRDLAAFHDLRTRLFRKTDRRQAAGEERAARRHV